ncbi:MAG: DNA polymerase III subunit alpha [Clostridiales bacterium]|jgi:DNA polymerase-3 subunit alpha|nr:DNA polymerase III subunit alpha [Clostridiales bacterium]
MSEPSVKPFVHLHVHSSYSLLDGATPVDKLIKQSAAFGMPAVAITDHGNMYAACKLDAAAIYHTMGEKLDVENFPADRAHKVKPIFGCEFYIVPDRFNRSPDKRFGFNHLILLAKNEEGYLNLAKLNAVAFLEGFYMKPRIDDAVLRAHCNGLVCLSACLAGEVPQALVNHDYPEAVRVAQKYRDMFAPGDYYIEIQDHNIPLQQRILPDLARVARDVGVKLVATNDVHYLNREDAEMQKVMQCIAFKRVLGDSRKGEDGEDYFPTDEFYFKSPDEMWALFAEYPEALLSTVEIADKCNVRMRYKQPLLPTFSPPDAMTPAAYLRKLTYEGLARNYPVLTDVIKTRAEKELDVIIRLGFVEYFLIVWDFIRHAESKGIPVGPGRGSGAGSIVAFSLGITKVEPLRYDLLFERFLNEARVSMPDFDIDFCSNRREEVIDYVKEKYGRDRVSQIVTFGTLAAKAAIKDVARVYGYAYGDGDRITKLMPGLIKDATLLDLVGRSDVSELSPEKQAEKKTKVIPELKALYDDDPTVRRIFDMAARLEGKPRQTGIHAAGVVICRDPIADHIPMASSDLKNGERGATTQYDMTEIEKLGFLKMDFLALLNLTDIAAACAIIAHTRGVTVDFYDHEKMTYDDANVFAMIAEGDTHAVFQLESPGMKRFMRQLRPTCLEDIIAGVALFRPGPMDFIDDFCRGKQHPEQITYDHPSLEPILAVTYGVMVYQEQVMRVVQEMVGYSLGEADKLRRIMSKKKTKDMEMQNGIFLDKAKERGIDVAVAQRVFDKIKNFAGYAFNKSHAAAYAYVAYQTAYLKRYYFAEYFTAVLNNRISKSDELKNYFDYVRSCNVKILPPDVNASETLCAVEDGNIRMGLAALKGVGVKLMDDLVAERVRGGRYKDLADFVKRCGGTGLNKKSMEALILAGALDCFKVFRSQLMQVYGLVLDKYAADRAAGERGQLSFFDVYEDAGFDRIQYPDVGELQNEFKLKKEKEVLGIYVSGHPLDDYTADLQRFEHSSRNIRTETDGGEDGESLDNAMYSDALPDGARVRLGGMLKDCKRIITKAGAEMAAGQLEDLYGTVEVMIASGRYEKLKALFVTDTMVTLQGSLRCKPGDRPLVWIDRIETDAWRQSRPAAAAMTDTPKLYVRFDMNDARLCADVEDILLDNPGTAKVVVVHTDGKGYPWDGMYVDLSGHLTTELQAVLPPDDIKTK